MLESLNTRFRFVTTISYVTFDPIYITATFLTPAYCSLLNDHQNAKAKSFLQELMNDDEYDDGFTPFQESRIEKENDGPPLKRFKHLNRVSDYLRNKNEERSTNTPLTSAEEEIELYMSLKVKHTDEEMELDPLDYWIKAANKFPKLSPVACDIMCTPASSAPVERVFSISGEASQGRRNRLLDHNLERETLLRKNKHYLHS